MSLAGFSMSGDLCSGPRAIRVRRRVSFLGRINEIEFALTRRFFDRGRCRFNVLLIFRHADVFAWPWGRVVVNSRNCFSRACVVQRAGHF